MNPLSLAVLVSFLALSASAGDGPQTFNCGIGSDGASSRDCSGDVVAIGRALATYASVPGIEFVHVAKMSGVALECDFGSGRVNAKESASPAYSLDCGQGKVYVATGNDLFSMARKCKEEGIQANEYDVIAATLAHEIAHQAASHGKRRVENIKRICNDWSNEWLKTPEAEQLLLPVIEANKGKPKKELQSLVVAKILEVCQERKQAEIARSQIPLEKEADSEGAQLLRLYNAGAKGREASGKSNGAPATFSEAGMECAMKGLQDLDGPAATGAQIPHSPYVSDHPSNEERIEAARKQRLMMTAVDMCAQGLPGTTCQNRFVSAQP